jgi:hypothetical protein
MDRTMKKLLKFGLAALMALGFASLATAAMYKWVDKNGTVHYSQQPPAEGNYETMHVHTESPSGSDSGSQSKPTYSTPDAGNTSGNGSSNAIKQAEAKGEAQRQQKCETAKKALQTYTTYRRLRKKDGTVIRLDDNERAKRINEAKSAIREFCQ